MDLRSVAARGALVALRRGTLAALGAFAVCALFLLAAGQDPARAAVVIVAGSLGSVDGLWEVITRSVPLCIIGLGLAIAFRANVFNVGGDGQFLAGAALAFAVVQAIGDAGPLAVVWLLLAGALGGALYGGIAGALRARFDANEIIVTIMLNYVAVQAVAWLVRGPLQETARIMPRSDAVPENARLIELALGQSHAGIFLALALALLLFVVVRNTVFGFQLDAVGENREAAEFGGIASARVIFLAMAASGGLCGLAGAVEVAGVFYRLEENMAPGAGITGIAVALLARLHPLAIPFTALLFGILTVGAGALQRDMGVPFPLLWIIEAMVIIAFLLAGVRGRRARAA
ncbi:MAG: ABC transporter permease [Alphaproteobacteria bacterium]